MEDITGKKFSPGFHTLKKDIYLSVVENSITELLAIHSDENIQIFNAMFHNERIGVLFSFNRPAKVLSSADNHILIDKSCGMGVVFWSDAVSVHANDTSTMIVAADDRYDTETS